MKKVAFTVSELRYLEVVSWHDSRQSVDARLRRIAARANRKLQEALKLGFRREKPQPTQKPWRLA
jgi:hypothetical protein